MFQGDVGELLSQKLICECQIIIFAGSPSYEATLLENKLCIIVFNIPITRGHPSNKARFVIPQQWVALIEGTTV